MLPITANFTSEAPLHPEAAELLTSTFARGWADPGKIGQPSREAFQLLHGAKETFAAAFGVRSDEIYFLGEPPLGFHLGINGLLSDDSVLYYSGTDRAPVHAIAHDRQTRHLKTAQDALDDGTHNDVKVYQPFNPETGIHLPKPDSFQGSVFVDNTAFGVHSHLPENWSTAMWQSRSWHGPSGLGVLAVRQGTLWRNPLPHNDINKVPQSFSISLALASAVALENFTRESSAQRDEIEIFKSQIVHCLKNEIGNVVVAGEGQTSTPFLISASIYGVDAERLLHLMNQRGLAIDTGSACLTSSLQPSHVLAAMGLPTEGNIRLTLHPGTNAKEIQALLVALKECVNELR